MEELWAEIKGFEDYQVSSLGRIKSFKQNKNGKILAYGSSGSYYTVILRKGNNIYNKYIHRLVAETFIPNVNNLSQVNHKDENTHNNCVDNLEWVEAKTNNNYGTRTKKAIKNRDIKNIPHFRKVKCIETEQIYPSISEAARTIGVCDTSISRVCKGERKTCKGFHQEFVD